MLFRKMLRDIRWNKMQFISIFLMSFLGIFVFSGISGEYTGVEQVRHEYYAETNLADGWIYGDDFSKEDEEAVKKIEGITGAQRRTMLEATGDDSKKPTIYMYFEDENRISMPKVKEGEEFDPALKDCVWIDYRFADAKGLKIGDSYTYMIGSLKKKLKIAGLIIGPEYGYYQSGSDLIPDFEKVGYAYASAKVLDTLGSQILQQEIPYNQIVVTTNKKDVLKLEEKIDDALNGGYYAFLDQKSMVGIETLNGEMHQHKVMSWIFPVAFMLIAVLAIITTMNRMVSNQRTQIGTLKALGVKKGRITRHFMCYSFWLSLTGGILGAIVGPLTLPHLFFPALSKFYTLPEWREGFTPLFFVIAVATVGVCTLTTYLSCRKILNVNPAETLRPAPPRNAKRSLLEKTFIWKKLGFTTQYNLRDVSRAKVRTLMGLIGTLSCMVLLVCAFSMYDSIDGMVDWLYKTVENYETKMLFKEDISVEEAQKIQQDIQGELMMSSSIEMKVDGKKETAGLTVVDADGTYQITNTKLKSRPLKDGEIAITMKLAKRLGIKAGDSIKWHLYNSEKWITSKVTIVNRMPSFSGMLMSRDAFEKTGYEFTPTSIGTKSKVKDYKNDYIVSSFSRQDLYDAMDQSMESMSIMVVCLIVMAAILAIVVLYNLGLLSFAERQREMATLKVVGFNTGRLRKLLMIQNTWLAVIGVFAGAPVGVWLVQVMVDASGDGYDMIAQMSLRSFSISAAITLGLSVLVSAMFSGKIKRLDMVGALKGVE